VSPKHSGLDVQLVDGQYKSCGLLVTATLRMGQYRDSADFASTKLKNEDVILGMPWLQRVNPMMGWRSRTLYIQKDLSTYVIFEDNCESQSIGVPLISAVQFAKQIKKHQSPAWICVVKATEPDGDAEKRPKVGP